MERRSQNRVRANKDHQKHSRSRRRHEWCSDNFELKIENRLIQLLEGLIHSKFENSVRQNRRRSRSRFHITPPWSVTEMSIQRFPERRSEPQGHKSQINESVTQRFVGRMELVPEFDVSTKTITINQWLNKIDSLGDLYGCDDWAKIFCIISRLTAHLHFLK